MPDNEDTKGPQPKGVSRRQFLTRTAAGTAGAIALTTVLDACGGSSSSAPVTSTTDEQALTTGAWKFGVMADTQWTVADDGYSPNTSAVGIAAQIQQQFINQGVKFVVHVGDLCDIDQLNTTANGTNANDSNLVQSTGPINAQAGEYVRALYSQALYNAGIGFFPLRGNHDEDQPGAEVFQAVYPQTQTGKHQSPSALIASLAGTPINGQPAFVPGTDYYTAQDGSGNPVPSSSGSNFTVGSNFSSPSPSYAVVNGVNGLAGLTYSFDYNGARFILLDQFAPANGAYPYSQMDASIGGDSSATYASFFGTAQQPWISQQLSGRTASHSFVFAHKGLLTCNHADNLFTTSGGNPSQNTAAQNAFMTSLYSNGVKLYINGHDHMYDRSIVTSPDGTSTVMQVTCASNSSKFYPPQGSLANTSTAIPLSTPSKQTSVDLYWNVQEAGGKARRQVASQELFTVGYYIVTVNGSLVNVDYYSASLPTYQDPTDAAENLCTTAQGLNFVKRESFGYGLNGKQFPVAAGKTYTVVQDSSAAGTSAKILSGTNGCATTDACYLPYTKVVTTGWTSASSGSLSDIVTLWGINPWESASNPDTFVLSMGTGAALSKSLAICALDSNGSWSSAVNQNTGGTKNFVYGPWNSSYGLGTYGVDPTTNTAWAVLNYDGMFAIGVAS